MLYIMLLFTLGEPAGGPDMSDELFWEATPVDPWIHSSGLVRIAFAAYCHRFRSC